MSETLDVTTKFVGTVRGTDKVLMLVEFMSKVLIQMTKSENLKKSLLNLVGPLGDTRMLLRYYGLIPLINSIIKLESSIQNGGFLIWIQRLEYIANLIYFPLEHTYWLGSHEVISITPETKALAALWSCRCWAAYVFLYFIHLLEDYRNMKFKSEKQRYSNSQVEAETNRILLDAYINLSYLPMTLHFSNFVKFSDKTIALCGLSAAIGEFVRAWKASK
eukprot:TRINITY_DN8211_c0_g1_i1.p1 TRINITY_DN8211_c0_g1~~TRINITY_DN8211_c0_g1_i1.p1  ORF type:complete len:219 (+),score=16.31 TRINITY_DN8211_c0_g1_i1:67-723(+)